MQLGVQITKSALPIGPLNTIALPPRLTYLFTYLFVRKFKLHDDVTSFPVLGIPVFQITSW